jgi:hypothetical protein
MLLLTHDPELHFTLSLKFLYRPKTDRPAHAGAPHGLVLLFCLILELPAQQMGRTSGSGRDLSTSRPAYRRYSRQSSSTGAVVVDPAGPVIISITSAGPTGLYDWRIYRAQQVGLEVRMGKGSFDFSPCISPEFEAK